MCSESYRERCGAVLGRFAAFLQRGGVETLREIRKAHVDAYRETLEGLAAWTMGGRLHIVKTFFDRLLEREMILLHPADHFHLRRPKTLPPVPLSQREIRRFMGVPDIETVLGLRDRTLMEVLYATGMRRGELLALTLGDVDLAERICFIRRGKGDKGRWVPLTRDAADYLRAYLDLARPKLAKGKATPYLFLSGQRRPLCSVQLGGIFRRTTQQAGMERRVYPHLLRHTAACHLLENGASLFHVQMFLGHARPTTTQGYTRTTIGRLKEVLKRCHPRN